MNTLTLQTTGVVLLRISIISFAIQFSFPSCWSEDRDLDWRVAPWWGRGVVYSCTPYHDRAWQWAAIRKMFVCCDRANAEPLASSSHKCTFRGYVLTSSFFLLDMQVVQVPMKLYQSFTTSQTCLQHQVESVVWNETGSRGGLGTSGWAPLPLIMSPLPLYPLLTVNLAYLHPSDVNGSKTSITQGTVQPEGKHSCVRVPHYCFPDTVCGRSARKLTSATLPIPLWFTCFIVGMYCMYYRLSKEIWFAYWHVTDWNMSCLSISIHICP